MTEFQGKKKEQKKNHHTITGLASKNTLMPNPVGNFKNVLRVLSFNIAQILDIVMGWVGYLFGKNHKEKRYTDAVYHEAGLATNSILSCLFFAKIM